MPLGSKNDDSVSGNSGQERPVIFQKYFKTGGRTYASQIKIATNGKKYLVLTEGLRDPETQELRKHVIRVFESDLKEFFAMLQETVVYLRSNKDNNGSIVGVTTAKPPFPPASKTPSRSAAAAKSVATKAAPARQSKAVSMPVANSRVAKPAYKPAYKAAGRSNGR